jgi:hypothetical protein
MVCFLISLASFMTSVTGHSSMGHGVSTVAFHGPVWCNEHARWELVLCMHAWQSVWVSCQAPCCPVETVIFLGCPNGDGTSDPGASLGHRGCDGYACPLQAAPPQGFPFWGMPPNALLQLAMQQPSQHGQSAAQFNQQQNLNLLQTHAAMHHHGQMVGPHAPHHHQHAPHRKHHHHSGKHHSSKDSGQTQRLHRPVARPAGTTERSSLDPTTLTSYADANTTGTPEGGVEEGSPDVQAPLVCAMPAQYVEEGDVAGGRNEHTATSDQPRRRRGAPPRPAGSDGDSAISGEHSDGREPFGQAGDTGATSQDRTVGGLAMQEALLLFVIQRGLWPAVGICCRG